MKFNKEEQKLFDEGVKVAAQVLIGTMDRLNIPNYIEAGIACGGYTYKLQITKTALNHQNEK